MLVGGASKLPAVAAVAAVAAVVVAAAVAAVVAAAAAAVAGVLVGVIKWQQSFAGGDSVHRQEN